MNRNVNWGTGEMGWEWVLGYVGGMSTPSVGAIVE